MAPPPTANILFLVISFLPDPRRYPTTAAWQVEIAMSG